MRPLSCLLELAGFATLVLGDGDLGWYDDLDLTHFVSRPDIKAPILDVKIYDESAVMKGKWFVSPYRDLLQQPFARNYYLACQSGPHIYDLNGELIYSGACKFRNQNAFDFRVFEYNGSQFMSGILHFFMGDTKGHAFVMNERYQVISELFVPEGFSHFNMHHLEFRESDSLLTAMYLTHRVELEDVRELGIQGIDEGFVGDTGIQEINANTGESLFEWWPAEEIPLTEGTTPPNRLQGPYPNAWNWFHANSIDKNSDGDYLLSSRFTNAIYKISGYDKSILWQLGGKSSDFVLEGAWNFSRQHDAHWISCNDDREVISFLDNGGDTEVRSTNTSSALIVELEKTSDPPVARILKRIWRPDGGLSEARGNFQLFNHAKNVLVSWSDNGYMSEHDEDGKILLEGRFRSERFVNYRAYKYNFTGSPQSPPDMKVFSFGETQETATTVAYVSWNGATEVSTWRFYSKGAEPILLGSKSNTGFETVFHKQGYYSHVYAEALNSNNEVLGTSETIRVQAPEDWAESMSPENMGGNMGGKISGGHDDAQIWLKTEL